MHRAKELTPLNLLTVFPHLSTSLMYDCGMGKWQQLGPRVYSIDVSSHRRLINMTIAPRGLRLVRALARWLRCLRVVQGRDCCGAEAVAWVWTKTNSSLRGRVACVYEIPGSWDYTTRVFVWPSCPTSYWIPTNIRELCYQLLFLSHPASARSYKKPKLNLVFDCLTRSVPPAFR